MNYIKFVLTLMMIISVNRSIIAQKLNGKVIYKYRVSNEFLKLDSIKKNKEVVKDVFFSINESLKNYQDSFEFVLKFDEVNSNYSWQETMDVEDDYGAKYAKIFTNSDHFYYMNLDTRESLVQFDFFDKKIIIKRKLNELDWELKNDSKQIGNYICFKATTIVKSTKKTKLIEAWYTPQIPSGFGPKEYGGLPGLILELIEGDLTYYVSSIKLSEKMKNKIIKPAKGEIMTPEELEIFFIEFDKSKSKSN